MRQRPGAVASPHDMARITTPNDLDEAARSPKEDPGKKVVKDTCQPASSSSSGMVPHTEDVGADELSGDRWLATLNAYGQRWRRTWKSESKTLVEGRPDQCSTNFEFMLALFLRPVTWGHPRSVRDPLVPI